MSNKLLIFFCVILFIFLFPSKILALESINISNFPSSKVSGEEFDIVFEAFELSPLSVYYIKGLGGGSGSALTEVDTWNNGWFQQNSSWSSMPTFSANPEGSASATLKLRFDQGVETATKDLKLRVRKVDTDKNIDSNIVTIQIIKATLKPTSVPTVQPTSTPTVKPTEFSTPKLLPTKTPSPKPIMTELPIITSEPEPVLGINSENEIEKTIEPKVSNKSSSKKIPSGALILIFLGLIFLGYGGYLLYNIKNAKKV